MFKRYTAKARRTIFYARNEALRRGATEIEPEDIVLGITYDEHHEPGCPFEKLHENAHELRGLIGLGPPLQGPLPNREIPLSNISKTVLVKAELEASRDHRYAIGDEHLLRGVLLAGGETAAKIALAGYTLSAMRVSSREAHRLTPDMTAPLAWRFKLYSRRLLPITALIVLIVVILYLYYQN